MDQTGEFASDIQTTIDSIEKWKELIEDLQTDTEGQLLENLQGLTTVYSEMQPDIEKARARRFVGNDENSQPKWEPILKLN